LRIAQTTVVIYSPSMFSDFKPEIFVVNTRANPRLDYLSISSRFIYKIKHLSGPKYKSGQPGCQLGDKDNNSQPDELEKDKRYDTPVDMAGGHFGRCHRF
jgi:hypothetical protein